MIGFCLIRGFWRERREVLAEQATGFTADVWLATNKTLFEAQQTTVSALMAEIRTPMGDSKTLRDLDNLRLFFMDAANFAGEMYAGQVRPWFPQFQNALQTLSIKGTTNGYSPSHSH